MNRQQVISGGIILVGLGLLFLLNTLGVISHFNWRILFRFWPVIIILIGLNLILKYTPLWWVTSIIFVLGIIALFFVNDDSGYHHYNYNSEFNSPFFNNEGEGRYRSQLKLKQGLEKLDVVLNLSAGRLFLNSVEDEDNLYEISSQHRRNHPQLSLLRKEEGETAYLKIEQEGLDWINNFGRNSWQLSLTPILPLYIDINVGAGDFNLNLEELKVEELNVNSGAGDLDINLGNYVKYIKVNSAAANLELKIPEGKAISIKTSGLIANNNFTAKGLLETGDNTYQSTNFNNTDDNLRIEISAPASNIKLDFIETS